MAKVTKKCRYCYKEFLSEGYRNRKFCSHKCSTSFHSGENNPKWSGGKPHCIDCGKLLADVYSKRCVSCYHKYHIGDRVYNYKGPKLCIDCGARIYRSDAVRCKKCFGKTIAGEKNYNWKGGTKQRFSTGEAYAIKKWAKDIYKRDFFTCCMCGKHCGKDIEAHHIYSWKEHPEKRFDLTNGITLCFDCHVLTRGVEEQTAPYFIDLLSLT